MQKRRGGGKRRKEKKYEAFFNNSTLGTLGTLRLLWNSIYTIYTYRSFFSETTFLPDQRVYTPCCGQEKRPRLNFVLERHFFLLSFLFVVSNFRDTRLYRDEIYRSVGQLSNRCNLRSKKIIFRFCSYIKYLNKWKKNGSRKFNRLSKVSVSVRIRHVHF